MKEVMSNFTVPDTYSAVSILNALELALQCKIQYSLDPENQVIEILITHLEVDTPIIERMIEKIIIV